MEPSNMARLYVDAAKNLSRGWSPVSVAFAANRRFADAARLWADETRAAEEVLARAGRRSGEEVRAVLGIAGGPADVAFPARFGELTRAQTFLWSAAGLAAAERLGRAATGGEALPGFAELAAS